MEILGATNRQAYAKLQEEMKIILIGVTKNYVKKLADVLSGATLVEETININLNLSTTQNHHEKTSNYLAIKWNVCKIRKQDLNLTKIFFHVALLKV